MTPEEKARQLIDARLAQSGWVVQDLKKVNPMASLGVAVREYPTSTGPVDYALFVDGKPVGVIEAKKDELGENITVVEGQSGRYANSTFKYTLDPDDKHYIKRKADLDDRLYKMYDKIEDTESLLIEARAKKTAIEAEKLTADNIYKVLIYFDKLYAVMDEQERRQLMESLISEIHIFEERKPNGQWLKSIEFKLPIIEEDMEISLDNDTQVER